MGFFRWAGFIAVGIGGIFVILMGSVDVQIIESLGVDRVSLFSLGLGIIAIGIAFVGLDFSKSSEKIAKSSEERMTALTNLNYYEKMAMLEGYKCECVSPTDSIVKRYLEKVCYDIKAISELDQWIDDDKIEKRKASAIEAATLLREKYPNGEYADVIDKLSVAARGKASENDDC